MSCFAARVLHASQLSITSGWFCLLVAVAALLTVCLVPWRWDAWRRRRLGRSVTVLVAVGVLVLACAAEVNRLGSFYPTLGTLIGTSSDPAGGSDLKLGRTGTGWRPPERSGLLAAAAATGQRCT